MKKLQKREIELYRFDNLGGFPMVSHFISTRKGGVSRLPHSSLNFALHVGDNEKDVLRNRRLLADALGLNSGDFIFMKQIHSGKVMIVTEEGRGKGAFSYEDAIDGVDALITDVAGVCLMVQTADCVPILLLDPNKNVVAAVHAGWRGTMKQITKNTLEKMQAEFDCEPQNLVVGIGPSIGSCCFESENPKLQKEWEKSYAKEVGVVRERNGKVWIDLWQANKIQLMRAGVKEENIEIAGICTSCNVDEFYSFKRDGETGRFGVGIFIN